MTHTTRLQDSRNKAMKAAAAVSFEGPFVAEKVALAAVYADIYKADAIRAQGRY